MKTSSFVGWLLAGISAALFIVGHLLFFDVLWPLVQLRHDGQIAVGAWIVGALLSGSSLVWCRRARAAHWLLLGLYLLMLLGLLILLSLAKPTHLF